jgi:hypothetical protein
MAMGRLALISLVAGVALAAPFACAQSVDWPLAGPARGYLNLFARHRGLGLLLTDGLAHIADLEGFASGVGRVVLASEREPMARSQYVETLHNLIGAEATSRLLAREVGDFSGRLGIQHRDVPYALLNKLADGGIIFSHLAQYYALSFPHALRAIPVPAAAAFGSDIALARAAGERSPIADAFARFFLAAAATAYPDGGFSPLSTFAYGSVIDLTAR